MNADEARKMALSSITLSGLEMSLVFVKIRFAAMAGYRQIDLYEPRNKLRDVQIKLAKEGYSVRYTQGNQIEPPTLTVKW